MSPLITCLCITENRLPYLQKAIDNFLNQTYENKELLILYKDYDIETEDYLGENKNNQVKPLSIPSDQQLTLGEIRNISIKEARGEYFCQWDDDDWYHDERLEIQYNAALNTCKDGSILMNLLFFNKVNRKAYFSFMRPWENSIFCKKNVFKKGVVYKNINQQEDTMFVNELIFRNKLCPVNSFPVYIYIYHGHNTWNRSHFDYLFSLSQELPSKISGYVEQIVVGEIKSKEASELLKNKTILQELNYFYRPKK